MVNQPLPLGASEQVQWETEVRTLPMSCFLACVDFFVRYFIYNYIHPGNPGDFFRICFYIPNIPRANIPRIGQSDG
jgi:hypothetical protein